jgi:hypothetical protein
MNQVGDIKTFTLSVVPPASSGVYSYVWKFWDGTVAATVKPTVTKQLNIGGNPLNSRKLLFTCTACMEDGQSETVNGEVIVNNPPQVVPSPEITVNDFYFPYATQIKVRAFDIENDAMVFTYYNSAGQVLGNGSTSSIGLVNGTWNGTVGSYNGYQNIFNTTIQSEQIVTLKISDAQQGTTSLAFGFYGQAAAPPIVGVTASQDTITADASSIPDQRIGMGQFVDFSVYANDPVSQNFSFLWNFWGSNGWAANSFSTGTTSVQPDGSVRNAVSKNIEGESGGLHTAIIRVRNNTSGQTVEFPIDVNLIANTVATSGTISIRNQLDQVILPNAEVAVGTKLIYSALVEDPENDIVNYKWTFVQPSGTVAPTTLRLWGRSVILDTTGYSSGYEIIPTLVAYDRMKASLTVPVPAVTVI